MKEVKVSVPGFYTDDGPLKQSEIELKQPIRRGLWIHQPMRAWDLASIRKPYLIPFSSNLLSIYWMLFPSILLKIKWSNVDFWLVEFWLVENSPLWSRQKQSLVIWMKSLFLHISGPAEHFPSFGSIQISIALTGFNLLSMVMGSILTKNIFLNLFLIDTK